AIRQKTLPLHWLTFNTQSMLGGALLGQKKYAEAEPLLLAGYQGMKKQEAQIPPQGKVRLTEAVQRLVQLYEATGNPDEAAEGRKGRKELEARWGGEPKPQSRPQDDGRPKRSPGQAASPTQKRCGRAFEEVGPTHAWHWLKRRRDRSRLPPACPAGETVRRR